MVWIRTERKPIHDEHLVMALFLARKVSYNRYHNIRSSVYTALDDRSNFEQHGHTLWLLSKIERLSLCVIVLRIPTCFYLKLIGSSLCMPGRQTRYEACQTGYSKELSWCQLCRHWWHRRLSWMTTSGAISDDKIGIILKKVSFQCFPATIL